MRSSEKCSLRSCGLLQILPLVVVLLGGVLSGCTSRGMTVTSLPPGAEISINRRVVGQTPIRVNYTHYGTYRIELRKDRFQTLVKEEALRPPSYGYDPLAFVADNVIPARFNDEVYLHYVMNPVQEMDRDGLMERAKLARDGKVTVPSTQAQLQVAMAPPPAHEASAQAVSIGAAGPQAPDPPGPAAVPQLELPKELRAPIAVQEEPPQGPRIVAPEAAAGSEKPKPEAAPVETRPKPEVRPTRMRRTPKGEILIYEEEPVEDPAKKK